MMPVQMRDDGVFRAGNFELPVRKGQVLNTADQVILYTIAAYLPNRPVSFGVSSGRGSWLGMDPHLVFQGLAFKVVPRADTMRGLVRGIQGTMVDSARTRSTSSPRRSRSPCRSRSRSWSWPAPRRAAAINRRRWTICAGAII